jgi:hypothetical protein
VFAHDSVPYASMISFGRSSTSRQLLRLINGLGHLIQRTRAVRAQFFSFLFIALTDCVKSLQIFCAGTSSQDLAAHSLPPDGYNPEMRSYFIAANL